jgi:hypothetical protein
LNFGAFSAARHFWIIVSSSTPRDDVVVVTWPFLYNWTVPRPLLFQMADSAFGDDRIAIRPDLKLAGDLIAEFRDLKEDRNEETGTVRIVHREGKHDDMAKCLASTVWWTMQPKHGGVKTVRAVPHGADIAIARGEIDPRSLPVVYRKAKPWRYS